MKKSFTSAFAFLALALLPVFTSAGEQFIGSLKSESFATVSLNVSGNSVSKGSVARTPDNLTYVAVATTTKINAYGKSFIVINGASMNIISSATPAISTMSAVSGQEITIMGGANTVTLSDNGTVSGSLLELGSATRALTTGDILKLIYYKGKWYETAFVNN